MRGGGVADRRDQEAGLALLTSLVVLVLLASLAAVLLDARSVELRMAAANAAFVQSRQAALAQLETWLEYLALTVPGGEAGATHCLEGNSDSNCSYRDLPLLLHEVADSRLEVLASHVLPPRSAEQELTSAVWYRAAHYEVTVDARAEADGPTTSLSQGVWVLYPGEAP